MSVHVAVDAHNLVRDERGIGRYARAVLSRALHDPRFRFSLVVRDWFPNRQAFAGALDAREVALVRHIPGDADVVWFPWNGTFLDTRLPSVATVHDAAPFAFPAADARLREREQAPFRRTAATARRILVQSHFTATEVESRLDVASERIVVTPLASDAVFAPGAPLSLPEALRGRRYILNVGAHDERKNTGPLAEGFGRAFPHGEVVLAFTRKPPSLPPNAVVVDARSDATLVDLYRGAAAVAVPSTYEGFGLPLLEALACGAPALAARAGALPEVGGGVPFWVDEPLSAVAWESALQTLMADDARRAAMAFAGPVQAKGFSWERCTAQTLDVLAAAAES